MSVSQAYQAASRRLLIRHLSHDHAHPWRRHVRARTPFLNREDPRLRALGRAARDLDDVSSLIADIEPDHKGAPVLVRQYVRLGGRFLGFNVDPDFSDVVDGLVLVDLARTERKILDRYFGTAQAGAFLAHHGAAAGALAG